MTVIVEYTLIDNFLLDLFVATLISEIVYSKKIFRFISAAMGSVTALLFPLIPEPYVVLYKILSLILSVIPLQIGKDLKRSIQVLALYVVFSAVFSGVIQLLLNGSIRLNVSYTSGGKVSMISLGAITSCYLIKQTIGLIKTKAPKSGAKKIVITHNGVKLSLTGFYDSGNLSVYKGEGLNFLSKNVSRKLDLKEIDEIFIETVNGSSIEKVYVVDEMRIYSDKSPHIYTNVKMVKTDKNFNGFDVLLSANIKEMDNGF